MDSQDHGVHEARTVISTMTARQREDEELTAEEDRLKIVLEKMVNEKKEKGTYLQAQMECCRSLKSEDAVQLTKHQNNRLLLDRTKSFVAALQLDQERKNRRIDEEMAKLNAYEARCQAQVVKFRKLVEETALKFKQLPNVAEYESYMERICNLEMDLKNWNAQLANEKQTLHRNRLESNQIVRTGIGLTKLYKEICSKVNRIREQFGDLRETRARIREEIERRTTERQKRLRDHFSSNVRLPEPVPAQHAIETERHLRKSSTDMDCRLIQSRANSPVQMEVDDALGTRVMSSQSPRLQQAEASETDPADSASILALSKESENVRSDSGRQPIKAMDAESNSSGLEECEPLATLSDFSFDKFLTPKKSPKSVRFADSERLEQSASISSSKMCDSPPGISCPTPVSPASKSVLPPDAEQPEAVSKWVPKLNVNVSPCFDFAEFLKQSNTAKPLAAAKQTDLARPPGILKPFKASKATESHLPDKQPTVVLSDDDCNITMRDRSNFPNFQPVRMGNNLAMSATRSNQ